MPRLLGQASGQSMQGIGIFDGGLLIVDRPKTDKSIFESQIIRLN